MVGRGRGGTHSRIQDVIPFLHYPHLCEFRLHSYLLYGGGRSRRLRLRPCRPDILAGDPCALEMRKGRMCCSCTERNIQLNMDSFCSPSQLPGGLCSRICFECTASPQNRCTETGRPYIILYYHYCGAQDMGPDRTDMRAGLAQVAVPLEEVAGEGWGFCNQSADINIFRVCNRKLLRLLQRHFARPLPGHPGRLATRANPCSIPAWHLARPEEDYRSRNPRCGLSGIIN